MTAAFDEARIAPEPPDVPFVAVDGTYGSAAPPHLNLSHWPGNTTPVALRHDLSTGSALAFARLDAAERERLAGSARLVVNNHYDTDGCCAAFALVHPEQALEHEHRLLAIAASGDFFRVPDEDAFCADLVLTHLADPVRSPLTAELGGLGDEARHTRALREALAVLPRLCAGELEPWRPLWAPELERLRADRHHLAACEREEVEAKDLTVWRAHAPAPDGRAPGRHALFGETEADRALYLERAAAGTRARLVLSTLSWFQLASHARLARPDLDALVTALQEREDEARGAAPTADGPRWRTQGVGNASPELWYGRDTVAAFAEHNPGLAPSALAGETIEELVRANL